MALGQPTGLSKEVCLFEGTDWLKFICQSEDGERSVLVTATKASLSEILHQCNLGKRREARKVRVALQIPRYLCQSTCE